MSGDQIPRCRYTWEPSDEHANESSSSHASCCYRPVWRDYAQCIWHVEVDDEVEKPIEDLRAVRETEERQRQNQGDEVYPPGEKDYPEDKNYHPSELLDGAQLSGCDFGDEFGATLAFDHCSMREINFSEADLLDADLSGNDLRDANFSKADLRDADLSKANLGRANLSETALSGADLSDTDLGHANLSNANLRDADLLNANLGHANLSEADLEQADLSKADLEHARANPETINLSEATLRRAEISEADMRDADFSNANLVRTDISKADLARANLSETDLKHADLSRGKLFATDFSGGTDLRDVSFAEADLRESNFSGADMRRTNLSKALLEDADLSESDLRNANLSHADLEGANLSKSNLRNANLSNTDLRDANLSKVDLRDHNLSGADLRGADFSKLGENHMNSSDDWNQMARACHDLSSACAERGLIGQARHLTTLERRARRKEATASGNRLEAIKSWISWQTTGYGISVRRVVRNMVFLFGVTTLIYLFFGITRNNNGLMASGLSFNEFTRIVYYSIVTFTTTPPSFPTGTIVPWIVMIEAFLGTLLIVLLGYVLGNRESF